MKNTTPLCIALTLGLGLSLGGCGKDKSAESSETKATPAPAKVTSAAAATTKGKAEATAPAVSELSPCQAVLKKSWAALQPTFALVGQDASNLKKYYLADKSFLKKCEALNSEKLACLSKSDNPIAGIGECKINEGLKRNDKLHMPGIRPSRPRPGTLPEAEQATLLASVVGTWKSEWKSYDSVTTWKIDKTGQVKETVVRKGEKKERSLTFGFSRANSIEVRTSPSSSQYYGYFRAGKKVMYVTNNLTYRAHEIESESKFLLSTRSGRIVYDAKATGGAVCKVLGEYGDFLDASCVWSKEGGVRIFKATVKLPMDKNPSTETLHLIAGRLLDYRLVDTGTFKKK